MNDSTGEASEDTHQDDHGDTVADTLVGDLLTEPHNHHGTCGEDECEEDLHEEAHLYMSTGSFYLILEVQQIGGSLNQEDNNSEVTGVLIELHASALTLFLHLLEAGHYHAEQLDNDRGSDVGHDTQCEDRGLTESTTREHIEQLHQTTAGELAHCFEVSRVDTREHHVTSKAVKHDEQERGDQALAQVLNLPDVF